MFELSEEEQLMSSADGSVRLTTHRLIQETDNGRNQMMLEDYQSIEIVKANIGNYKLLTIIFASLLIVAILTNYFNFLRFRNFYDSVDWGNSREDVRQLFKPTFFKSVLGNFFVLIFLFLFLVSFGFYLLSRRMYIKVHGKFNTILIRINSTKTQSIQRFLDKIVTQSNIAREKILRETRYNSM